MKASDVEGAREHILVALRHYEMMSVLIAGLSVMGYLAREIMRRGVASSHIIVIAFGTALTTAFKPAVLDGLSKQEERLGGLH